MGIAVILAAALQDLPEEDKPEPADSLVTMTAKLIR